MMRTMKVKSEKLLLAERTTLCSFMQTSIESLKQAGRTRTSETYATTLNSFLEFMGGNDIELDDINAELILSYESYLKSKGLCMNTLSFYMRILRAVYNRAVEYGVTRQTYPFKSTYTGVDKTVKRAIPFKIIKQIKELDLSHSASLAYARDMFLLSFYTRGMSFIDMAYLKKTDLENGILSYKRKKTGQFLTIKWEDCMQEILDRYPQSDSSYLFPILVDPDEEERKQYKNSISTINRKLKKIGDRLSLSHPLTLYVARHSWASIAKEKHIPISIISNGMGHESEKTTLIYLKSLDTSIIDNANRKVLRGLF